MMPASTSPPLSATLRLTNSRNALLKAMADYQASGASKNTSSRASELNPLADLHLLKTKPVAYVLAQSLLQIWKKNPWSILGQNAFDATGIMLAPIAQRSPFKLVTGAFVIGGLIFFTKPWRYVNKSALIAALVSR